MINILILSAGTRDKVVQYFKEALAGKGKVIATDCSPYAPAIYEADEYVLVPRITEPGYLDKILEICREKQITGVLSLIDPELSLLADKKERFLEVGTVPIVQSWWRAASINMRCMKPAKHSALRRDAAFWIGRNSIMRWKTAS